MIWWRVDPEISRQLLVWRYMAALLIALFAVPSLSALAFLLFTTATHLGIQGMNTVSNYASVAAISAIVTWAHLLLSVPLFLLARRSGAIGLLPTIIAAIAVAMVWPGYTILIGSGNSLSSTFPVISFIFFLALLYAGIAWFSCLKLHPHLFTQSHHKHQPPGISPAQRTCAARRSV